MYLPSFYKTKFEKYAFNTRRVLPFAIPALIWGKLCPYCSHLVVMATDIQHHLYRYHPPSPRRREENPRIMIVDQINNYENINVYLFFMSITIVWNKNKNQNFTF